MESVKIKVESAPPGSQYYADKMAGLVGRMVMALLYLLLLNMSEAALRHCVAIRHHGLRSGVLLASVDCPHCGKTLTLDPYEVEHKETHCVFCGHAYEKELV